MIGQHSNRPRRTVISPVKTHYTLTKVLSLVLPALVLSSLSVSATIARRGNPTTATTTGTSLTIGKPSGLRLGDILIVNIVQVDDDTTAPTLTFWYPIAGGSLGGATPGYGALLYRVVSGTEGANFTFTLGPGTTSAVGTIVAFSGVDVSGATPFDVPPGTISVQPAQTSVSATSTTTVSPNAAVIMFGMAAASAPTWSDWTTTSPGALTELYDAQATSTATVGAAWALKAAAGATGDGVATLSAPESNGAILVTLRPQIVNAAHSTVSPGAASITADGLSTQVITVQARDVNDNNLTIAGDSVVVSRTLGTGTVSSTTDLGNGTYTAIVTAPTGIGSGTFTATLGGTAVGTAVSASSSVITYEPGPLDHFAFEAINNQTVGSPFSVNITALDANDNTATSFEGTASLTTTAGSISPPTSDAFTAGVLSGQEVSVTEAGLDQTITASADGRSGTSGLFTVNKAGSIVTIWPTASDITYGQTLADSTLSGGVATPEGTFAFTTPTTAPDAGTAMQEVTYTPTDTANYNTATATVSVTVNKADPGVTTWPTASDITYGQTLADSTLSGGVATPEGTFAFTTPTTAPDAGTAMQEVTYTPTDTANYNTASATVSVTVNKADPGVTTWPTASDITYGQTLADSTLNGGVATPEGTFAFTTPTTAPDAGTAMQEVTYTPTDTANYNTASATVSVTVNKADPGVTTWPTASDITYGQTLADSTLNGGVATPEGTFAFTTPTTAPDAGTAMQEVTYTPTDTANYNTATATVSVTVNKADPGVTTWPTASDITYGQTLADSTLSGGVATPEGTFAFTTPTTAPDAGTAMQEVTYTPTDTANYNTASATVSVTVNKADPGVTTWPTASDITYGQTLADSTLSGGVATPEGTFAFTTPTTAPDAGTAMQEVTYTPTDTANYNTASATVSVTVNKADPGVTTWPTASDITYGQTLADSTLNGGVATPEGTFAFTTPTTAPDAGTAMQEVTYTPTDTANYNTATATVSVTVNKADPGVTTWPTASDITYGQTLADSTLSGGVATPEGTFAFTAPTNAPDAGTAMQEVTYTPTDTANYNTASATVSVTVNKADPGVTTWPTASDITYGQTLADSTLSGGVATPEGTFAFTAPTNAPDAGTVMQEVTYTPTDTANYNTASATVSVTVNKADPGVTTWPTASDITYGQTLADSTLSGGVATPEGTFAFTAPTNAPDAGTAMHEVTYTPTDTANYNTASATVSVTVNKADPGVTTWPTASDITYGQTLADSTLSGGVATPEGTFAFTAPTNAPDAGTAMHEVTYTPTDTANYNTTNATVSVTVNKADPGVTTWPTASDITYGQTLADSTLSGGVATPEGTFAFTALTNAPDAGTAMHEVTYTPTDTANYNTTNATVSVTVNKADPGVTTWPTASDITYGQTLADSTLSGGVATPEGTFAFTAPTNAPDAGTAMHEVTYTPTDTANYNTTNATVSVTVNKADSTTALVSSLNPSALNASVTLTATVAPVSPGTTIPTGNVQFYTNGVALGDPVALSDGEVSLSTTELPAGTNTMEASYLGDDNYLGSTNSLDQVVTVEAGQPETLGIQDNGDGTVTVTFAGTPGSEYIVQATIILSPPSWENVSTNTVADNGQWTYTNSSADQPQRFYRAAKP